ncbi:MAG TPA: FtsX-like permease family protein [Anaerolineae bacterium]|nr:FtsX-like permease family protein [Anaerolineae bacterium]
MVRTGYRKILRDLWRSKGRTLLVVLSITVGVFAVGLVAGMSDLMLANMTGSFRDSNPAHLTLFLNGALDDRGVLDSLERLPGVAGVEGATQLRVRWRTAPNTPWRDATLGMREDFERQRFNRLALLQGEWPGRRSLAVENTTLAYYNLPAHGSITLLVDERERTLPIAGVIRDLEVYPPAFGGDATFYASPDLIEAWYGARFFNQLRIQIPVFSEPAAEATAQIIRDRLERIGPPAGFTQYQDPNRHFNQDIVDSVMLILRVLAVLSLALGLFLVINTINAIIAQQLAQIGLMKAVGAMSGQVLRLYLTGVLIYGLLALVIAVPIGAAISYSLSGALLALLNISLETFRVSPPALAQQIGIGLLTPMLAALWPVLSGARITVSRAISTYGIGAGYGASLFDRVISRIRGLPRPLALTLRNTFRRKARVALTQITLTIAGVVFIMVVSASESFTYTIDSAFNTLGLDVAIGFGQMVRIEEAEAIAIQQSGVRHVESWMYRSGTALRQADDLTGERINLRALPPDTQLFQPTITGGRWLLPADGHALVLNDKLASELGVAAGDAVTLDLEDAGKREWLIVGTVFDLSGGQTSGYVPRHVLQADFGLAGRTSSLQIRTTSQAAAFETAVAQQLRETFEARGIRVGGTFTGAEGRQQNQNQFDILVALLLAMSALIALVGSIGLAGTLSINVLERRREIGVMRAIGASSRSVAELFIGEGLLLGLLAWALALPLSVPAGQLFAEALGDLFEFQMIYRFAWSGALAWLVIIVLLSIAASAMPALRATRLSVRETLAYE